MEKHLAGCPRCLAACESLKRTLAVCRSSGPDVPVDVQAEVRAALNRFLQMPAGAAAAPGRPQRPSP